MHLPQEKMFKGKCFTFRWRSFLFKDVYEKYQEYGIRAYGYYFKEEEFASKITNLLKT